MVNLLEEAGGGTFGSAGTPITVLSATQATAYHAAASVPAAQRTSTEQAIVDAGDELLASVAATWSATQQQLQADIMEFATSLQSDLQRTVRKNVRKGWGESAVSEMLSVFTARMVTQHRLLLELEARLNASPY